MKNITILIVSLVAAAFISILLYLDDDIISESAGLEWKYKGRERNSRLLAVPILLYHNINGRGPFSINAVTLRRHFQLIKDRGIRVISLKELDRRLGNPEPSDERAVTITFDDGYYSMYSLLAPLAREYNYPITLFIHCDAIARVASKILTWDRLRMMEGQGLDIQAHSLSHIDLTKLSRKNDP